MKISQQLLDKYNVPVPRYTSYPPANYFGDNFSEEMYREMLVESNERKPEHVALYIHIPFCNKICFYCGCNACAIGKGTQVPGYLAALKEEIKMVSRYIDPHRKVSQIHYGGGTPNALLAQHITEINDLIFNNFKLIDEPEIAIECNPAYLDEKYLESLSQSKFNRFSLGIQDFNNDVLKGVNREPSRIPVGELKSIIKSLNPKAGFNLDFIYGLPAQTVESFSETIQKAVEIRPDRLVTFSYAHVPWMKKHQQILEKKGLPAAEQKMEMFMSAYDLLKQGGYLPIGFDHYVLPHDELNKAIQNHELHRNFQGYCTRRTTGQVYAFGVSAITQLEEGYVQNTKEIDEYINMINRGKLPVEKGYRLKWQQIIVRQVLNDLLCNKYLNWKDEADKLNVTEHDIISTLKYDENALAAFVGDGLINYSSKALEVTELGSHFIRNIAASLDPEYKQGVHTYSKIA